MRGPGGVAAPVAVGLVGGLVQAEGDVDDAGGELQDARVVGQQLELGQGLADIGTRFERGRLAAVSSASDAPTSRSRERSFCKRRIAASRVRKRTTTCRSSARC